MCLENRRHDMFHDGGGRMNFEYIKPLNTRMDKPDNANAECPGTNSEQAGKGSGCEGCPNQSQCATAKKDVVDPEMEAIAARMRTIKRKILVLSGKGGVGE